MQKKLYPENKNLNLTYLAIPAQIIPIKVRENKKCSQDHFKR